MHLKQRKQLADVVFLARVHEHDYLRLRGLTLQRAQRHVQIGNVRPRVVVAPAVDELAHEEIRLLFLEGTMQIARRGKALGSDTQRPVERSEIGVEGRLDQGIKRFHMGKVYRRGASLGCSAGWWARGLLAVKAFERTIIDPARTTFQAARANINRFPLPAGWSEIVLSYVQRPSGFKAVSFERGSEIVISFAGTNFTDVSDWTEANVPLAFGNLATQLVDAARYYLEVKAANPGATISFTGHSLGGGLAALMAVFFDEQAITFDQAPFAAAANDTSEPNWNSG